MFMRTGQGSEAVTVENHKTGSGGAERTVITTWEELRAALSSLPNPEPGHERVFRGQTVDYPQMLPRSMRGPVPYASIWSLYSRYLLAEILGDKIEQTRVIDGNEIQIQYLWLEA